MALIITDECINCDVCEPECPNDAISQGVEIYVIDPAKCTECVGHFDRRSASRYARSIASRSTPTGSKRGTQLRAKYEGLMAAKSAADTR